MDWVALRPLQRRNNYLFSVSSYRRYRGSVSVSANWFQYRRYGYQYRYRCKPWRIPLAKNAPQIVPKPPQNVLKAPQNAPACCRPRRSVTHISCVASGGRRRSARRRSAGRRRRAARDGRRTRSRRGWRWRTRRGGRGSPRRTRRCEDTRRWATPTMQRHEERKQSPITSWNSKENSVLFWFLSL